MAKFYFGMNQSLDGYVDHTAHAAWFGTVLPLRLEVFQRS